MDGVILDAVIPASTFKAIATPPTIFDGNSLISVDSNGIQIHSTEADLGKWVDIKLLSSAFEKYEAESFQAGINLNRIVFILDLIDEDKAVNVTITKTRNAHYFQLSGDSLTYNIQLLDPEKVNEVLKTLNHNRSARVTLPGDLLDGPVGLADDASEEIALGVEPTHNIFYFTADDTTGPDSTRFACTDIHVRTQSAGIVESIFPLDNFKLIQKTLPGDVPVTIDIGNSCSGKIHYTIANELGELTFTIINHVTPSNADRPENADELLDTHPIDSTMLS